MDTKFTPTRFRLKARDKRWPSLSLSRPISPIKVVVVTVIKNLQIYRRYIPNLIGNLANMGVRMMFFLLLANTVTFQTQDPDTLSLTGKNLFIFFQGALLLFVFNGPTLWGPINAVTTDLYNGTLEYLYSNPCSRYAYYVGTVISEVLINLVVFLPLYLFLIIYSQANLHSMLMVLLVCILVLIALTAMGIMLALLALLWRQVGSIAQVMGILFEMLAGAYLPLSAFPQFFQYLAYFLPYTWGYDLIRYYSFKGKWLTILPLWQEWAMIILFAVLYTLISRHLLGKAEALAKRSGLHMI
jgi:ABC-2 type transport system permease protein